MAFRTLILDTHSKVEYSLNYLIFRTVKDTKRVLLDEVHTVIFQSTAISVTTSLLSELTKRKIKIIFCDEKHNPQSELIPLYGSRDTSGKIISQLKWSNESKDKIWKAIVERKIINQALFLKERGKIAEYNMLSAYSQEVVDGDSTNREGHSAKVYFNNIFYKGFTREDDHLINKCLDYGYTILLSQINRIVTASGYLTQIGIHHRNEFNQFNFSCDLLEPFRFLVDKMVIELNENNFKDKLIRLLSKEVKIDNKIQSLTNALQIYFNSVIEAIRTGNTNRILFIEYE